VNNEKIQKSRRKLLKLLAASGGVASANLPLSWQRPLIGSTIVPAHAQMSGVCYVGQQDSEVLVRECICISGDQVSAQVLIVDSLFTASGTVAQFAAGISLSPPSSVGVLILDGVIVNGTLINGHITGSDVSIPYSASKTGSCGLQGVTYSVNCGISSALTISLFTDITFTFTVLRDGQPSSASEATMVVEFTFSPSGSTFTLNQGFSLSGGTFNGTRTINGGGGQDSVSMLITSAFGIAVVASCSAGPISVGDGG